MLNSLPINPMQFIQTAGVSGFVSGVQTGMLPSAQSLAGFRAIGQAIDSYVEVNPTSLLADLRTSIGGLPEREIGSKAQEDILGLLTTHQAGVDRAVRMFEMGGAAVFRAPFDLPAEWRWIPAGEFRMGSAKDDPHRYDDEKVLETVMTGGFFMLDHPVTNGEFQAFLEAIGRGDLRDLDREFAGNLQPAVGVIHEEATAYSQWLGEKIAESIGVPVIGRLPIEAEWERAAKGPDGTELISPATSKQAHFGAKTTRAVDHLDVYANGYELKDVIGNVWEWTSSPKDDEESRFLSRFGASGFPKLVIRGGSWFNDVPGVLRAACRGYKFHNEGGDDIGFRPVLAPQDSGK